MSAGSTRYVPSAPPPTMPQLRLVTSPKRAWPKVSNGGFALDPKNVVALVRWMREQKRLVGDELEAALRVIERPWDYASTFDEMRAAGAWRDEP